MQNDKITDITRYCNSIIDLCKKISCDCDCENCKINEKTRVARKVLKIIME